MDKRVGYAKVIIRAVGYQSQLTGLRLWLISVTERWAEGDERMKILLSKLILIMVLPAIAQQGGPPKHEAHSQQTPRANQGHLPPPPAVRGPSAGNGGERLGDGRVNEAPHVNHNQWYGHDLPNDPRYRQDHPFPHGRFGHFGPNFRYRFFRVDPHRHWFWIPGGFYFEVAAWDWPIFADWCWDCGDDFVVYEDPDHLGWYLLYNMHTGVFVHVQYMGV